MPVDPWSVFLPSWKGWQRVFREAGFQESSKLGGGQEYELGIGGAATQSEVPVWAPETKGC